jgi:hypothetical protein
MRKIRWWIFVTALFIGFRTNLTAQNAAREIGWKPELFSRTGEELRTRLGDLELVGEWVYDDLEEGYRRAKLENRPLMVVFR